MAATPGWFVPALKRLSVASHLLPWLPDVTLHGLADGQARIDLRCRREGDQTRWEMTVRSGELTVGERPWRPLAEGAGRFAGDDANA